MSAIPDELRDSVVRKLERALDEGHRKLSRAEGQVDALRQAVGETEGVLLRNQALLRRLEDDLQQAARELDRSRAEALERLQQLRRRAEEQKRAIEQALAETDRRHHEDWAAVRRRIEELALDRQERDRRLRQAAEQALARAAEELARGNRGDAERLDLQGDLAAAELQLASARALAASRETPVAELLTAAHGAEEAMLRVAATIETRGTTLSALAAQFADDAAWLEALLRGDPTPKLPCQAEDLGRLLHHEREILRGVIAAHLARPAAALTRWNGHVALVARLSAVRELVGGEILAARRALPAAAAYDVARYRLGHIWEDLELRFGAIRDHGGDTAGAWADASDRKSTYLYFLDSQHGELQVEVPWTASILVRFEGALAQRYPPAQEPGPEALAFGDLARRWRELALRLDNPTWSPERQV